MQDLALRYDPATRRCDAVIEAGQLRLDPTPATQMLVAIGCDRRARADDTLPADPGDPLAPNTLLGRRGWPGDALDLRGRRTGSRLWLLDRAKQTEPTRQLAEQAAREALAGIAADRGLVASVAATWLRAGVLALDCALGRTRIALTRAIG